MEMEMEDRLPRITVAVEHRPIPALIEPILPGEIAGDSEQGPDQGIVLRTEVVKRGDVPARHDQQVERRLRIQILEGDDRTVVVNAFSGNQTRCDLAEQAVDHPAILIEHRHSPARVDGAASLSRPAFFRVPATIAWLRNRGTDMA
jgi:hypothetical protein